MNVGRAAGARPRSRSGRICCDAFPRATDRLSGRQNASATDWAAEWMSPQHAVPRRESSRSPPPSSQPAALQQTACRPAGQSRRDACRGRTVWGGLVRSSTGRKFKGGREILMFSKSIAATGPDEMMLWCCNKMLCSPVLVSPLPAPARLSPMERRSSWHGRHCRRARGEGDVSFSSTL